MRRFEFKDKTSNKFWEVDLDKSGVRVRFGRIGTAGQTKTTACSSREEAKAAYERLIREKTGKGYVELLGRTPPPTHAAATSAIAASWARIEAWFAAHAPSLSKKLEPGATAAALAKAEKALGAPLPPDLRELLRLRNGRARVFGEHDLLSVDAIVRTARSLRRDFCGPADDNTNTATSFVKGLWWNPRWVPFVMMAGGDIYCVDLDPAKKGKKGQVILFEHDDSARPVIAQSLRRWLDDIARDLEAGLYGFDPKCGFTPPLCGLGFGLSAIGGRDSLGILTAKRPSFEVSGATRLLVHHLESVAPFRFGRGGAAPSVEVRSGRKLLARWKLGASRAIGREPTALRIEETVEGRGGFTVTVAGAAAWPCFVSYRAVQAGGGKRRGTMSDDALLEVLEPLTDRLAKAKNLPAFVQELKAVASLADDCGGLGTNADLVFMLVRRQFELSQKRNPVGWGAKPKPAVLADRRRMIDLAARIAAFERLPQDALIELAASGLFVVFEAADAALLRDFERAFVARIDIARIKKTDNGAILLFNMACAFARAGDKKRMLHYVDLALANGKTKAEFRVAMRPKDDFEAFAHDADLVGRVGKEGTTSSRATRSKGHTKKGRAASLR